MSEISAQVTPGKPRQGAKRRATQNRIMDAFERVLLAEGVEGLGINAIVAEAGVGKGLIYKYFGGLDGLAEAWLERSELNPSPEQIAGEDLESFSRHGPRERLARIHVNYAGMLRDNPAACQVMAQDLGTSRSLPRLLEAVRRRLGYSHELLVTGDPAYDNEGDMARIFILQAAANYLAMRANSSPDYNGLKLDTDEGWQMVMQMLARVALGDD